MDRNSAIGLTLIGALLLAYFYWFSPKPETQPETVAPVTQESAKQESTITPVAPSDSVLAANYGDFGAAMTGSASATVIETEDVKATFNNKGGVIGELELKKFKTYSQEPLKLVTPDVSQFRLVGLYQGKEIDLYTLYYNVSQTRRGDSTVVTYSVAAGNASITQEYTIPDKGYTIEYAIRTTGFESQLTGDNLAFEWNSNLKPLEKDLAETRKNTTITYYTEAEGFDELKQGSNDLEAEVFATPVKWVAVKEKFFLTSIIAKGNFAGGEIQKSSNIADSSIVKKTNVKLLIPKKSLADGSAKFTYYIGPNDYQVIGKVTEGFSKNVYLGWPPVFYINKFVIFPVFHFLTQHIGNYGIIIIILVFLLKLVLFPLSYKSYLSMAKMKVLKPELDEIKERVGDDMAKVQQEQMKLYGQVGVSPLSGCIPVLLQMPILLAMFYLFPASIELRQQPLLWAEDLSTYDSLIQLPFALPFGVGSHISLFTVFMTATTLISIWQNNQISSVQGPMKSMSYIMPIMFFFFLNSFSTGLTFYYSISTMVTFAQQAVIRRFVDENKIKAIMEENRKKNAAGGGKKSKFMSKLEDAMKASEEARRKADDAKKKKR